MCGDLRQLHILGGVGYYVTFIDYLSRKVLECFLKQKSEVFQWFECKTMVEKQKGQKVKFLRSDNGAKCTSAKFKKDLTGEDIKHQLCILG